MAAAAKSDLQYPPAESVIVAFSGGKDSLAVLDLAVKHFSRVEPFFMYLIPGLDYTEAVCGYAEKRFGVKVRRYPHWMLSRYLNAGIFCDPQPVRKLGMKDVLIHARRDTGLFWIGLGYRRQESLMQLRWLAERNGWKDCINSDGRWAPIMGWSTKYLIAYLRRNRIVVPGFSQAEGFRPSGVDLSPASLQWLQKYWPRDYERLMEVFPHARAQASRGDQIRAARAFHRQLEREQTRHDPAALPVSGDPPSADQERAV